MTSQPPDPPEPESSQPAPDSESIRETLSLTQGLVRLAGVILVLIVIARGLIFLSESFSPPAPGPDSASNPDANAT
jgi:hypothetical protein